jgi:hypothetical protein
MQPAIKQVWDVDLRAYGADKVWKQMNREGVEVAHFIVARLMRSLDLQVSYVARWYTPPSQTARRSARWTSESPRVF